MALIPMNKQGGCQHQDARADCPTVMLSGRGITGLREAKKGRLGEGALCQRIDSGRSKTRQGAERTRGAREVAFLRILLGL